MDQNQNSHVDKEESHADMLRDKNEPEETIWPPAIEIAHGSSSKVKVKENPFTFFLGYILYLIVLYSLICIDNALIEFLWKRSGTQSPVDLGFNLISVWLFVSFFVYLRLRRHHSEAAFGMILAMSLALLLHILDWVHNSIVSNLSL